MDCHAPTGVLIFATYAVVQVTQLADATPTFDVYDSDNYPQVTCPLTYFMHCLCTNAHLLQYFPLTVLIAKFPTELLADPRLSEQSSTGHVQFFCPHA